MRTGKVARIADRVRKELGELTPQERDLAVKALRAALYEGFALDAATSDPNQMEACVRCGSIRIIRKGRGRDGSQRWKCMNCNRTFGVRTNRVMGMSKLKAGVWMRFLECFVDCLSLRKCAQRCGVCLKTAFLMRQRVIECIRRYTPVLRSEAGMSVQLDETYFRESFKGNHTKSAVFVMPRKAHKRTKALRKRGLSKEQICVATGVDDAGRSFLTVCGRGINLQAYLDWFQWLVAFTDGFGETDDDRLLARQLGNGLYRIRRRDYQRMMPQYMEYWQKAA